MKKCHHCGQPGHHAMTCGIEVVPVRIVLPKAMIAEIDAFGLTLERHGRKYAISRLLTEALVHRDRTRM